MKRIEYVVHIDLLDDEGPGDWCQEIREAIEDTGLHVADIGWISATPSTEKPTDTQTILTKLFTQWRDDILDQNAVDALGGAEEECTGANDGTCPKHPDVNCR